MWYSQDAELWGTCLVRLHRPKLTPKPLSPPLLKHTAVLVLSTLPDCQQKPHQTCLVCSTSAEQQHTQEKFIQDPSLSYRKYRRSYKKKRKAAQAYVTSNNSCPGWIKLKADVWLRVSRALIGSRSNDVTMTACFHSVCKQTDTPSQQRFLYYYYFFSSGGGDERSGLEKESGTEHK